MAKPVKKKSTVIVTGGAGFIGSAFVWQLNQQGLDDIMVVDELTTSEKWRNLATLRYSDYLHKDDFLRLVKERKLPPGIGGIIHMGACSSTTEQDMDFLMENNFHYTKTLAAWCLKNRVRFIYASSGATYGDGALGFSDDDHANLKLRPINRYGYSKYLFDAWAIKANVADKMVGLKFFNVFGPHEYHKGDMASVVYKAFHQIKETGKLQLFKSYKSEYGDGRQKRDFVYIKDCLKIMWWLLEHPRVNGIFNLGTGQARTWNDLALAVFKAMHISPHIEYIDMPETLRHSYQYFTEARMDKLKKTGCPLDFRTLEEGIHDYIAGYLKRPDPYLK